MLAWTNHKVYTRHTSQQLMSGIRRYIQGALPLYGICRRKLCDYASDHDMNPYEAIGFYNAIKTQRDIRNGRFNRTNVKQLQRQFRNIVQSMAHDTEPTISLSKIRAFFKDINGPFSYVYKNIIKLDAYANLPTPCQEFIQQLRAVDQGIVRDIRKKADAFEDTVADYLRNQGLVFRTEHDIRRDQDYTVTPDILFDKPVTIEVSGRKHTIYWIDAKNYTLINIPYIVTGVKQQAAKYNRTFGCGAMIFHYGFDKSIKIPNTLVLDGSGLDNESFEDSESLPDSGSTDPCDVPINTKPPIN